MAKQTLATPAAYTPAGVKSNYDGNITKTNANFTELYAAVDWTALRNAANDAAAAALSPPVPVGGLYRNGSVVMVRVA